MYSCLMVDSLLILFWRLHASVERAITHLRMAGGVGTRLAEQVFKAG